MFAAVLPSSGKRHSAGPLLNFRLRESQQTATIDLEADVTSIANRVRIMASTSTAENEAFAQEICARRTLDGKSLAAGAFVAIAEGRALGIAESFDEADALLSAANFEPGEGMICEIGGRETDVIRRGGSSCT